MTVEVDDRLAVITISRPEVRNALNRQVHRRAARRARACWRRRRRRGSSRSPAPGDKAFVAGADIGQLRHSDLHTGLDAALQRTFDEIEAFPKPTVAAVNGFALGGGCELAMACDIRIASDNARFGLPETTLSMLPGAGGTQRLARLVGTGRAIEMILTGRFVDAAEAHAIGLVTAVVPPTGCVPSCAASPTRSWPRARSRCGWRSWWCAPGWTPTSAPARSSNSSRRPCSTRPRTRPRGRARSWRSARRPSRGV